MNKTKLAIICGAATLVLVVLLMTTNPNDVPVTVLMAPFFLLFMTIASASLLACYSRRRTTQKYVVFSVVLGALPVLLLVLKSVGQLTIRDVCIAGGLLLLGWLYVARINIRDGLQR